MGSKRAAIADSALQRRHKETWLPDFPFTPLPGIVVTGSILLIGRVHMAGLNNTGDGRRTRRLVEREGEGQHVVRLEGKIT